MLASILKYWSLKKNVDLTLKPFATLRNVTIIFTMLFYITDSFNLQILGKNNFGNQKAQNLIQFSCVFCPVFIFNEKEFILSKNIFK